MEGNVLYYGDNLKELRDHIKNQGVDLVYLDPPFSSNKDYNDIVLNVGEAFPNRKIR